MSEPLQELSVRDSIGKVDIIRPLPREGESLSPRAHKADCKNCGEPVGPERQRMAVYCSDRCRNRFNGRKNYIPKAKAA